MSVYKLVNKLNDETFYVGSTMKLLKDRFYQHLKASENKKSVAYNYLIYKTIREIGKENVSCILIKQYEIDATTLMKEYLKDKEQIWINHLLPKTNKYKSIKKNIIKENNVPEKKCKICLETKEVSEFCISRRVCKECKKKINANYYKNNKDKWQGEDK